jgi:DMSO/TMAO reductase YedYZ heme-binding membrane subunit
MEKVMLPSRPGPLWLRWANRPLWSFLWIGLAASLVVLASVGLNGRAAVGWHAATRSTAVFMYGFWLLAFTASALATLLPNSTTRAVLARRRGIGLGFAAALGVHGLAILRLATLEAEILTPSLQLFGGALGFLLVAAMVATSNDAAVRQLGPARWHRIHLSGQIFLAGVFALTYAGLVFDDPSFWPGLALLVGALGLRAAAFVQSDRLRKRMLPTE